MHKRLEEKNIVPNSIIQMTEVKIKRKKKSNTCTGLQNSDCTERHETESKSLMIIYHPHPSLQNQLL